jgi:hypothetical protein
VRKSEIERRVGGGGSGSGSGGREKREGVDYLQTKRNS